MLILVSNDDGIWASGLRALCGELAKAFEVAAVAPEREKSAAGHGITVHKPLRVNNLTLPGLGVKGWSVSGTPADCIKLAVEELLTRPPDLVISGINRGENLATDVLYSGTVSAAIEGVLMGIPALAVSLCGEGREIEDYKYAACFTTRLASYLLNNNERETNMLLNVNVPPGNAEKISGVEITSLGKRRYTNTIHRRVDPRGRSYYWLAGDVDTEVNERGTDVWAVENGYVSITPIQLELTDYEAIERLKGWKIKKDV